MPGSHGELGYPGLSGAKGEPGDDGAAGPKGYRVSSQKCVFLTACLLNNH